MASFSVPLSGLQASSSDLNVIGNNLANLNTDGYTTESLTFGDLFSQISGTSGNGDPIQTGAGVEVEGTVADLSNGSVASTGVASNMALQGNGYFVVSDGGMTSYTRDGDFTVNSSGQLTTAAGQLVMGFPATNGVVSTTGALAPISVNSNSTIPASATSNFSVDVNLDSASVPQTSTATGLTAATALTSGDTTTITDGTSTFSYDAASGSTVQDLVDAINGTPSGVGTITGSLPAGVTASINSSGSLVLSGLSGTPASVTTSDSVLGAFSASTFSTPMTVYDSLGTAQDLTITYTNTGMNAAGDNTWSYNMTLPGSATGSSAATTSVASGTLVFNSSGQLISPSGTVPNISITGLADGAANMSLTWNLDSSGVPTITQEDSASANNTSPTQNGFAAGTLTDYSVQSDGTVEGVYSNGQTLTLGQVAVANFANPQGLAQGDDGDETATNASGVAVIGQAGGGSGTTITGGAVEDSNVDLSTQFASMIVAQESYDANAKMLTTLNQVDQSTIQMVS